MEKTGFCNCMKLKVNFDLENGEEEKTGDIARKLERIGGNERVVRIGGGHVPKRGETGQKRGNSRKIGGRREWAKAAETPCPLCRTLTLTLTLTLTRYLVCTTPIPLHYAGRGSQ